MSHQLPPLHIWEPLVVRVAHAAGTTLTPLEEFRHDPLSNLNTPIKVRMMIYWPNVNVNLPFSLSFFLSVTAKVLLARG